MTPALTAFRAALLMPLFLAATGAAAAEPPRMLPRTPITHVTLTKDRRPRAAIVAPAGQPYRAAAERIRAGLRDRTGAVLPILGPSDVVGPRGLLYKDNVAKRTLILIGTPLTNPALFPPYLRAQIAWTPQAKGRQGHNKN